MTWKTPSLQNSLPCTRRTRVNIHPRNPTWPLGVTLLLALVYILASNQAQAHGVSGSDGDFLTRNSGYAVGAYFYLGAKHMVTGYDHLLFLAGVVFFLHRLQQVALYVTLFAVGHSITLLLGVLANLQLNIYLVDAIIGLSVVFKALDNLGFFARYGWLPDMRLAVFLFGLCHGFGLATKLQDLGLQSDGLVGNMLAFNLGVEAGQLFALGFIVITLAALRRSAAFDRYAMVANWLLLVAGFILVGYQLTGFQLNAA